MDRPYFSDRPRRPITLDTLRGIVARTDITRAMRQLDSENPEPSPFIWERIAPGWVIVQTSDGTLGIISEMWLWDGITPQPYNDH